MSNNDTMTLSWEWPGGRAASQKLLIVVDSMEQQKEKSISNSASMAAHLPEPVLLKAHVIGGDVTSDTVLSLRLPKEDLGDVESGDTAAIGIVDNTICICIKKAPHQSDVDAAKRWLTNFSCEEPGT